MPRNISVYMNSQNIIKAEAYTKKKKKVICSPFSSDTVLSYESYWVCTMWIAVW